MLERVRVLIVDDDREFLQMAQLSLEMKGAAVFCVHEPAIATQVFSVFRPDVLVADLAMPVRTGYELIRTVRGLTPEAGGRTPALALSGHHAAEAEALRCGFDAFLPKPVFAEGFVAAVAGLAGSTSEPAGRG